MSDAANCCWLACWPSKRVRNGQVRLDSFIVGADTADELPTGRATHSHSYAGGRSLSESEAPLERMDFPAWKKR